MLFSVIIPVFQSNNTVGRCLDSLVHQAGENVEIIVVDDGSTDGSETICDEYAAEYSFVHCIHQRNQGVAAARNAALERACGKYLLFVDSDDYVANSYFSVLRRSLDSDQIDLLLFGHTSKPELLNTDSGVQGEVVTERETARLFSNLLREQFMGSLWSKVFRREIVERYHIRFLASLRISEDLLFVFTYMLHATGIRRIGNRLYYYAVNNETSLSKKKRTYLSEQLLAANEEMRTQLHAPEVSYANRDLQVVKQALVWNYYRNAYTAIRELDKFKMTEAEKRKKGKEICQLFSKPEWKPQGLPNVALAFPIRHRMVGTINLMLRVFVK